MSKGAPPPYEGPAPPPGFHQSPPGHYPPGAYPPPPQPQVEHTVIVTSTTPVILGADPTRMICPHCHASITTTTETEANTKTHLFALLLCAFGCWFCCCLPYCMDSCQSKKHYCPNCRAYLGAFSD